jgi:hypothetical protein
MSLQPLVLMAKMEQAATPVRAGGIQVLNPVVLQPMAPTVVQAVQAAMVVTLEQPARVVLAG